MSFITPKGKQYDLYYYDTVADIVADFADLNLQENSVVFVKTEKRFYYLNDGVSGDSIAHWTQFPLSEASFPEYVGANPYFVGDGVKVGASIYICIDDALAGEDPSSTPAKWLQIGDGSSSGNSVSFTAVDSVVVNHTVNNPTITVYVERSGDLVETKAHITINSAVQFTVNFKSNETGRIYYK